MAGYKLVWVTDRLAVGQAPMSFDDIEIIRSAGIDAIVNLCAEYCDLVDIERQSGFEVFYLPIEDDGAPELDEMEKALDWLDEAVYLGKKVLVHCRLGIGRTGTFVTSYLLRRGFGLKLAKKALHRVRSTPSSFYQWRLLRRYDKKTRKLTIREPSLEANNLVDLEPYFSEYHHLAQEIEEAFACVAMHFRRMPRCGDTTDACCFDPFSLHLIEAAYLSYNLNKRLNRDERAAAISRGHSVPEGSPLSPVRESEPSGPYVCPLSVDGKCIAYAYRPIRCRIYGVFEMSDETPRFDAREGEYIRAAFEKIEPEHIRKALHEASRRLFFALNSTFLEDEDLLFPIAHVVSGKFVQDYFSFLMKKPG
ncbi:MAG: dual specificity protein phosphatase family protein [Chloroflexota bacterium]